MNNYRINFEQNGAESTLVVEATDKSEAIDKAWQALGIMIIIKEIEEVDN